MTEKHLTSEEQKYMNVLGAKFVTMDARGRTPPGCVALWRTKPKMYYEGIWISDAPLDKLEEDLIGKLNVRLFPSISPGDCVGI